MTNSVSRRKNAALAAPAQSKPNKPIAISARVKASAGGLAEEATTKAAQSERTRALIINTAIQCLYKYGYAGTSMNLISKEASISRGPLHYHFKDPHELMAAVASALPREVNEKTRRRLREAVTIDERLTTILDIGLEQHRDPHHFVAMELLLAARNNEQLASAIRPHFNMSEDIIDDWWCEYLAMINWPKARLLAFRSLLVACLRGLSIDYVLHSDDKAHQRAVMLMKDVFLTFGLNHSNGLVSNPDLGKIQKKKR
jgi:AcrR family transcriptional regulator